MIDDHSNENVKKTNGVLLRNRQIHNIVGQISLSYVFGRHGLWPSLSNPLKHGCYICHVSNRVGSRGVATGVDIGINPPPKKKNQPK